MFQKKNEQTKKTRIPWLILAAQDNERKQPFGGAEATTTTEAKITANDHSSSTPPFHLFASQGISDRI